MLCRRRRWGLLPAVCRMDFMGIITTFIIAFILSWIHALWLENCYSGEISKRSHLVFRHPRSHVRLTLMGGWSPSANENRFRVQKTFQQKGKSSEEQKGWNVSRISKRSACCHVNERRKPDVDESSRHFCWKHHYDVLNGVLIWTSV